MPQFIFLKQQWIDIYEASTKANTNIQEEPRASGMFCRSALELLVKKIYDYDPRLAYEDIHGIELRKLINSSLFKQTVASKLVELSNSVVTFGNKAIHTWDEDFTIYEAQICIDSFYKIAVWFANEYRNQNALCSNDLNSFYIYKLQGDTYLDEELYEEAIEVYTKAIYVNPKSCLTYNSRGYAKAQTGKYREAIDDYNEAINIYSKFSLALKNRGEAKRHIWDYEGAISDYSEIIRLQPEQHSYYKARAELKVKVKDYSGAINDYEKSIKLDPE
ncbi:tetratricopeptide repeat protein [Dolichospermum sp. ST_con]|jgi:tetratricopeptide (TPR) repeat protein|nr:tetratricopeptide repeat protein [Dolichospermum sp. ST_con]